MSLAALLAVSLLWLVGVALLVMRAGNAIDPEGRVERKYRITKARA